MCKECKQSYCDSFCPEFSDYVPGIGAPRRQCASCGEGIYGGDFYYLIDDTAYCEECIEELDITELAELFGYSKISYLIEELGGEHRRD